MKDTLLVSDQTLSALRKKTIGSGKRNNRDIMPFGKRRVYSHDECKKFPVIPIIPPDDNGA